MLIDAGRLPDGHTVRADVCVIGAGPAGLTLAREFERHRVRAVVLESGGLRARDATRCLAEGVTCGHDYYELDTCRVRMLGGTSSVWGGWCRPLEPIDFEERPWFPGSGWPFASTQLHRVYSRARDLCLQRNDGAAMTDRHDAAPSPPPGDVWQDVRFDIQPLRFGDAYRPLIARSVHVDLLLNTTVVELVMDQSNRTTMTAAAVTSASRRLSVSAATYIVAAGGIENARLLLASRRACARGIGNEHDVVGRYFCEHLHTPVAVMRANDGLVQKYAVRSVDGISTRGGISLSDSGQRRTQQPGFAITLHDADDPHDVLSPIQSSRSYVALRHLMTSIGRGEWPDHALRHVTSVLGDLPEALAVSHRRLVKRATRTFIVGARAEQIPDPDNRVTLDTAVDTTGVPKVRLAWRPSAVDLNGIRHGQDLLEHAFPGESLRLLPPRSRDATGWRDRLSAAAHHMGTTRMHRDPRQGVVDEQCRVHDTTNLYIAGSSVFPTGGWAPPTLTIVALAMRLADHLVGRMQAR
jgi:choline dehydrogenase-like flavoprotein